MAQVKDSPETTKRSFLDRKGLTSAEVEEAFRRVPLEQPQAGAQPSAPVQGSTGFVTYQQPQQQQQQPSQQQGTPVMQQPVPAGYALVQTGSAQPGPGALVPAQLPPHPQQQEPLRWSQVCEGGVCVPGRLRVVSAFATQ